jgi:hypothetical protein
MPAIDFPWVAFHCFPEEFGASYACHFPFSMLLLLPL